MQIASKTANFIPKAIVQLAAIADFHKIKTAN